MGFYYSPGIGRYHLNEAKAPIVIPGNERHKWAEKITWGQTTTCVKCGCVKTIHTFNDPVSETFVMPGGEKTHERPACTGQKAEPTKPTKPPTDNQLSLF